MKDFYNITEDDLIDISQNLNHYYKSLNNLKENELKLDSVFGKFDLNSTKTGKFILSDFKANFLRDTAIKADTFETIAFYFNRKGLTFQQIDYKKQNLLPFKEFHSGIYFMQGGSQSATYYPKNTFTDFFSIHISPSYFYEVANNYPDLLQKYIKQYECGESFSPIPGTLPINQSITNVLSQLQNSEVMGVSSSIFIEAKILELLSIHLEAAERFKCNRKAKQSCLKNKDVEKIYEAYQMLTADLYNTPSLRDLAIAVGLNEKKLKQGFKQTYNNTVFGCLFEFKMNLAKRYLLDSELSVSEIAWKCGYAYPSHFTTAFKRFYACTPNEYRQQVK